MKFTLWVEALIRKYREVLAHHTLRSLISKIINMIVSDPSCYCKKGWWCIILFVGYALPGLLIGVFSKCYDMWLSWPMAIKG